LVILSTGSLYTYGLPRVFALAAEAGYDGIEVIVDHRCDTHDPAYLRRLSAEYGLPIQALHSPFVLDVPKWPADQLGRLEYTVRLAQELGVPVVVTHLPFRIYGIIGHWHGPRPRRFAVPVPWPRREPYYHLLRNGRLQKMEAETGVRIGVENMPLHRFLGLPINAYWFNRPEHLGRFPHLTLDTTHLGTWGLDPLEIYRRLRGQIIHVHLANYDGREHRLPSDGHLRLGELLRQLALDGYQGAVSVESQPDAVEVGGNGEKGVLAGLRQALAYCRRHLSTTP